MVELRSELEEQMLMNLDKKRWAEGLQPVDYEKQQVSSCETLENMIKLSKNYSERIKEENTKTEEEVAVANTGKIDPKNHLTQAASDLLDSNILQCMTTMVATIVF